VGVARLVYSMGLSLLRLVKIRALYDDCPFSEEYPQYSTTKHMIPNTNDTQTDKSVALLNFREHVFTGH
jgi:hypothetical protein